MAIDYSKAPQPPIRADYTTDAIYLVAHAEYVKAYNAWAANLPYVAPDGKQYPTYQDYLNNFYGKTTTTTTTKTGGADLDFTGAKSGVMLEMFKGYPDYFPKLQLSDSEELKFWSWKNESAWLSWEGITWQPSAKDKYPAGFFFTPLYNIELGRFLVTYKGGKTYADVMAGRNNMFFRNEVVYIKNGIAYDPNSESTWIKFSGTKAYPNYYNGGEVSACRSLSSIDSITGGYWAWKYMDGWHMLWRGVQFYIDNFLTIPYNVGELVAFGKSYVSVFKDALMKSGEGDRRNAITGALSVVNFLEMPVGKMGFWDKFVNYIPRIWATAASIITMGAGSPLLIAAVGALSSHLVDLGKKKAADDLQKIYDQKTQNDTNKAAIDAAKNNITDSQPGNTLLWVLIAAAGFLLISKKKRNGSK